MFFALQGLNVDFIGDDAAFLAKAGLGRYLSDMASHCSVSVQEIPTTDLRIKECEDAAVKIAGQIAREQSAAELRRREEKNDEGATASYSLVEVLTAVAPFVGDAGPTQVDDIQALIGWTAVARQTGLDRALQRRHQERESVASLGSNVAEVREWRKAQALWRSAASDLGCAEGDPSFRDGQDQRLLGAEEVARTNAETALLNYASHPAGPSTDAASRIELQRIREKIANDDVVLSYTLRNSKLIIWVVRKAHTALQVVDADDIRRQIALFYGSASNSSGFDLGPPRRLYELMISPIASELNDVHQVFIDADQEASAVPFAALIEFTPSLAVLEHLVGLDARVAHPALCHFACFLAGGFRVGVGSRSTSASSATGCREPDFWPGRARLRAPAMRLHQRCRRRFGRTYHVRPMNSKAR